MKTIQELRLARGWSQDELGKLVGVNSTSVRRWERGVVTPTIPKFRRLAAVFETTMEAITLVNEEALEQRAMGARATKEPAPTHRRRAVA